MIEYIYLFAVWRVDQRHFCWTPPLRWYFHGS